MLPTAALRVAVEPVSRGPMHGALEDDAWYSRRVDIRECHELVSASTSTPHRSFWRVRYRRRFLPGRHGLARRRPSRRQEGGEDE